MNASLPPLTTGGREVAAAAQTRACARHPGSCSSPGQAAPGILGIVVAAPGRVLRRRKPTAASGLECCASARKNPVEGGVPEWRWLPTAWRTRGSAPWRTSNGKSALFSRMQVRDTTAGTCARSGEGRDPRCPRGDGLSRGAAAALSGQPWPSLRPRRYRDPGTVQGKNQRAAPGPAGGGLHGVGAARGGRAVGSDPLPHPGVCGGRRCARTPLSALALACGDPRGAELWPLERSGTWPHQRAPPTSEPGDLGRTPPFQGRLPPPEGKYYRRPCRLHWPASLELLDGEVLGKDS